ncbi:hypothetical protein [Capnocytophaga sp. H2931]|uniref:hypothetical protein n=1 Tax=Capnocytophaga sp. H2931 TaxID=1945657 RepID=UPI0012FFC3AD|nr:hypothetical protein [Capnocytophaga sp. H2931]
MKTTQILIGMVMLLIACSDSKTQSNQGTKSASSLEKIIDLEKAIENPIEPLNLSDFVEDIEYIRPEYPASLVDIIFDVALNENYLLLQVRERLLCYSRDGKFLREIGKMDKDPKNTWEFGLLHYTTALLPFIAIGHERFCGITLMVNT